MRESIGSTFLYNIIFIFIIIVFGLITATLNYYKGYKINTRILQIIQKDSGYNSTSKKEIDRILGGIGYTVDPNSQGNCPERDGKKAITSTSAGAGDSDYMYCVYYYPDEGNSGSRQYYTYGVTTYIYIDLPIVGNFKIPVFSKGERIVKFNNKDKKINCQMGADCK